MTATGHEIVDFCSMLGAELELPLSVEDVGRNLFDELGFDSALMFECVLIMEERGTLVDESDLRSVQTLGDLFALWTRTSE